MERTLWQVFEDVARQRPDVVAIAQGEQRVTFAELRDHAVQIAYELIRHGVAPGDRCLIWAPNSPALAASLLASWLVGAIVALVNDEAPINHLVHAETVTEPILALVSQETTDAAATALKCRILLPPQPRGRPVDPLTARGATARDPASIFFTSGSTGAPKGVVQSHGNLLAGCRMVAGHLGLGLQDRILCPIPWSFDYGYGQLLSTVLLGIPQVLPAARNPFSLCEAIEMHRPTVFAGLPSIFALLLRGISPIRVTDLSSLRLVTNTGGSIPRVVFEEMLKLFEHCDISLNYGMTETYRSAGLPVSLAIERPESVGFAYPGVSLSIMRDDGTEAEAGEVGEIVHRGVGVFLGYWRAPEATLKTRRPDPLRPAGTNEAEPVVFTGDLGWKDTDGFLMIKGRRDRLIKSMGVRISPDEVEGLIRSSGLVRDVAVVGIPHVIIGQMVAAAVVPTSDNPEALEQLKLYVRQNMSAFMQPRLFQAVSSMPLTPNGKTNYSAVSELLAKPHGS